MVDVKNVYEILLAEGADFFTGVPDSLLKDFCGYIADHSGPGKHIIAANEGAAVGIAAGYHMSTGKIPVVYMQNSGIGNAVNPLLSLMDEKVYRLPVLMFVGWRGEPGIPDEPQHVKQGEVTLALFEAMQIPYTIMDEQEETALLQLRDAVREVKRENTPRALIIRKNTFRKYQLQHVAVNPYTFIREDALKTVIDQLSDKDIVVSTTGKLSRELFEYRDICAQGHKRDFLTVGSMGHSSSIALGIALNTKGRNVYCLDGDGALLMHTGTLSSIGALSPGAFRHITFNNGAHESVGGQPTVAFKLDLPSLAKALGYKAVFQAENQEQLILALKQMQLVEGPSFLEIKVGIRSRENLGRPTTTPQENKIHFMKFLRDE